MTPRSAHTREQPTSALKALTILEGIVGEKKPVAIGELATTLGLPKPTAHRIAVSLERENFLQREPGSRRFIAGPRLFNLAVAAMEASVIQAPRHAILQALSDELGETCNLGIISGSEVIYLDRVEAQWPLGLVLRPGSRVALHCTSIGKLLLSHLPRKQRWQLISATPLHAHTTNSLIAPETLEAELQQIRRQGFAIDNEEFLTGVVCAAVPVIGRSRRCCAGIAVSAPAARMGVEKARSHIPALQRAADRLTKTFANDP